MLGNGRSAFQSPIGFDVSVDSPEDAFRGEAGVIVELGVFDGNDSLTEGEGDVVEFDEGAVLGGVDFVEFGAISVSDMCCLWNGFGSEGGGGGEAPEDEK